MFFSLLFFLLLLVDLSMWNQKLDEATPLSGLRLPTDGEEDDLSSEDDLDSDQLPSVTLGESMYVCNLICSISTRSI